MGADFPGQFRYNGLRQNSQRTPYGQTGFHMSVITINSGFLTVWPILTSTDEVTNLMIWTAAEISSLIMAASVPFIRLFVKGKIAKSKSHTSEARRLNEQPQDEKLTPSIPTTVGSTIDSARPRWRAQSEHSDLLADSPPEATVNGGTFGP